MGARRRFVADRRPARAAVRTFSDFFYLDRLITNFLVGLRDQLLTTTEFPVLFCQHRYFLLPSFDDRYLQTSHGQN
jgi:hypothetical protein